MNYYIVVTSEVTAHGAYTKSHQSLPVLTGDQRSSRLSLGDAETPPQAAADDNPSQLVLVRCDL